MKKIIFNFIIIYLKICIILSIQNKKVTTLKSDSKDLSNGQFLFNINFISMPHYYQELPLDINHKDPFGNKYPQNLYFPGTLSEMGMKQIKELGTILYNHYMNVSSSNNIGLHNESIVTLCSLLKRCIQSSEMLMTTLSDFFPNVNISMFKILPEEYNYDNVNIIDENLYLDSLRSNKTEEFMNTYFKKAKEIIAKYITNTNFILDDNKNNHIKFEKSHLPFSQMDVLIDYYLNYESLKTKVEKNPSFKPEEIKSILYDPEDNLFDIKAFKSFFIINSQRNYTVSYLSQISKLLQDLVNKKYLSKGKMINLLVPDYIYSGIYLWLVTNSLIMSDLPGVSYGNVIALDVFEKEDKSVFFNENVNNNYIKTLTLNDLDINLQGVINS